MTKANLLTRCRSKSHSGHAERGEAAQFARKHFYSIRPRSFAKESPWQIPFRTHHQKQPSGFLPSMAEASGAFCQRVCSRRLPCAQTRTLRPFSILSPAPQPAELLPAVSSAAFPLRYSVTYTSRKAVIFSSIPCGGPQRHS